MSTVLYHVCCAPCLSGIMPELKQRLNTTGYGFYFFNPFIHPFTEFELRKECFSRFARHEQVRYRIEDEYSILPLADHADHKHLRCEFCYYTRLERTARVALLEGYDGFSTTLLISPYQDHELLRVIGKRVGEQYNIPFMYEDFRPFYNRSREKSRELNLYRQQFCGCLFSEHERYAEEKARKGSLSIVNKRLADCLT